MSDGQSYNSGSIKNIHLLYFRYLKFVFSILICSSSAFCILSLGSGQRLLYRLWSGLGLVLVLRFCAYSYGGVLLRCPYNSTITVTLHQNLV